MTNRWPAGQPQHTSNQTLWRQQTSPLMNWLRFVHLRKSCWTWMCQTGEDSKRVLVHTVGHTFGPAAAQYLCLSCRCRAGCSCRARRSTCHPHGQWSPRSPLHLQRSYPAGSPSSSHIPARQQTTGFSCFHLSVQSDGDSPIFSPKMNADTFRWMPFARIHTNGDTVLIKMMKMKHFKGPENKFSRSV